MHLVLKHLSFTGSEKGLAQRQVRALRALLQILRYEEGYTDLHHGDCIGGDDEADRIGRTEGFNIHIHPPAKTDKRAFCDKKVAIKTVTVYKPKPFLVRDEDIAHAGLALVACPQENHIEITRSGVWATVRYARKRRRKVYIIWPDGKLKVEEPKRKAAG